MFDKKAIKAAGLKDSRTLADHASGQGDHRRCLHHRLRRGPRQDPATATAAIAIKGKHRTWILDDGRSDEVKALAEELGCHYVRRLSSNGAKAGNINHALSIAKGDFFCVFDADFVPKQDFLVETVPFFVTATSPSSRRRRPTAT